jgi:hypothetical protein
MALDFSVFGSKRLKYSLQLYTSGIPSYIFTSGIFAEIPVARVSKYLLFYWLII